MTKQPKQTVQTLRQIHRRRIKGVKFMTFEEIGKVLGISKKTANNLYNEFPKWVKQNKAKKDD